MCFIIQPFQKLPWNADLYHPIIKTTCYRTFMSDQRLRSYKSLSSNFMNESIVIIAGRLRYQIACSVPEIPFWLLLMKSLTWLFYTHYKENFCVNKVIDVVTSYSFSKEGFFMWMKRQMFIWQTKSACKSFLVGMCLFIVSNRFTFCPHLYCL